MSGSEDNTETVDFRKPKDEKRTYDRSTIKFPYGDLDDAIAVAKSIHDNAGTSCTTDQLAAYMNHTASSGTFRVKLATASLFGLVKNANATNTITELGRDILDPGKEAKSKVTAFFNIPLYVEVHDKYKSGMLPPTVALEREMVNLGVASKQADKARQAFERSAESAGFFAHGKERLVMPAVNSSPPPQKPDPPKDPNLNKYSGGGSGGGDMHPFIAGLFQSLPQPNTQWDVKDQVKWLQTASNIFSMIYESSDDAQIMIKKADDLDAKY